MIAVDTSALVAIGLDEPERATFLNAIRDVPGALINTESVVETKMVLYGRQGHLAVAMLDDLLRLPRFEITPPCLADMDAAYAAFMIYGKGRSPCRVELSRCVFLRSRQSPQPATVIQGQ
jgi:ribonuclease VapC